MSYAHIQKLKNVGVKVGLTLAITIAVLAVGLVTNAQVSNTNTLTIARSGTGSGSILVYQAGVVVGTCPGPNQTTAYPCTFSFPISAAATTLTLVATPAATSTFVSWEGCTPGGAISSCTLTLNSSKVVTAAFALTTVQTNTLTIAKSGTGSGNVSISGGGTGNCPTPASTFPCVVKYPTGTSLILTATPAVGSTFTGWSDNCVKTPALTTCTVTLNVNTTITATYNPVKYLLGVTKTGNGSGLVVSSPTGISCGTDCSESYVSGTKVTLSARPDSGSSASWVNCPSSSPTTLTACTVTIGTDNLDLSVKFTKISSLTIKKVGNGTGTVVSVPDGINCGATCTKIFPVDTTVALTAVADYGSVFLGW